MPGAATVMQRVFQRAEDMGLSSDLAGLSGIEADRLDAMRVGAAVSATEFERLCRALAVDSTAMYMGTASNPNRSPARFRNAAAPSHPSPSDVRLLALAAEQGRILAHLMGLIGQRVRLEQHRRILGVQRSRDIWREGYDLGANARAALSPGKDPLRDLPLLLMELGVHVGHVSLSSTDIDGASIWEPGAVPVLLVNSKSHVVEHPGALRATLAHELCHLLHDAGERDLTTLVSWGVQGTGNYHEDLEARARAFSPAFLAPPDSVRSWAAGLPKRASRRPEALVKALAESWGMSFEGAAWHAKNCDIIEPDVAEQLAHSAEKPKLQLQEFETPSSFVPPAMAHSDLPRQVAPLWQGWATMVVLDALEEGCITVGRARELLTWS